MNFSLIKNSTADLRIFICGPTIYERSHLGHARIFIFFNFIFNYYLEKGYLPQAIVQLTDIDPKIYEKSIIKKNVTTIKKLTDYYLLRLLGDLESLNILDHFCFARVSDFMNLIKSDIVHIMDSKKGYSYGGNIYLKSSNADLNLLNDYRSYDLMDMPIDISEGKKDQNDILIWNAENFYPSNGNDLLVTGIPGWHFQDSAVIKNVFNGLYNIHGGAKELFYPHHIFIRSINERINKLDLIRSKIKWLRIGHVNIHSEKMSNSKKNTIMISKFIKKYNSNTLKIFFLMHGYDKNIELKKKKIDDAFEIDNIINNFYLESKEINHYHIPKASLSSDGNPYTEFMNILDNNFNTPDALKFILKSISEKIDPHVIDKMVKIFGLRYY